MPTERLYYEDSLLFTFEARVAEHGVYAGRPSLVLDRSAFYPESGGQLGDRGRLGEIAVIDVQADDAGVVHHLVEGNRPEPGTVVTGEIDRGRRRAHMALHTGQHILSRALLDVAAAETVSARLGETACTIDVDVAGLGEREIARAEELANSVIDDDLPIRAFFPEPDQLARLSLRREPKVDDHVRVVVLGEFDVTPCGGTHCRSTAQVGFVHVSGVERYKRGTRVTFASGRRARDGLAGEARILRSLGKKLSCGPDDVPGAIEKLRRELNQTREALGQTRAKLAAHAAEELVATASVSGETHVVAELEGASVELLRGIAGRVVTLPGRVALLASGGEEGLSVVVTRAAESSFDCGAFLKLVAQASGGRGGGRAERAEGRLPSGTSFTELVHSLLSNVAAG